MTAPDLSPAERAVVDRIEQAPDALGLREEVARLLHRHVCGTEWDEWNQPCSWAGEDWDPDNGPATCAYVGQTGLEDALLPLIERREAEALRETAHELWRVFLRLPHTPSPLGDYVQRRVQLFRDRADRLEP